MYESIDSTFVIGEKFQFTGKVERPTKITLRLKDTRDLTQLWIENSKINFTAVKDKLMDRVITGSKTQEQAEIHYERVKPLEKEFENLYQISIDSKSSYKKKDSVLKQIRGLMRQVTEVGETFIAEYPNSLESVMLLNRYKVDFGKENSQMYFSKMNKDIQETEDGKETAYYLNLPMTPKIGDKYVDFSLKDAEGNDFKLSDINAKYTLVEFWASWCGPCRKFSPELVNEYKKYKDQDFEIVSISLDEHKESWIKAIKRDSLSWTNVADLKGFKSNVTLIYNVKAIPSNFLMDEEGIIVEKNLRGDKLKNKLKELFTEKGQLVIL